MPGLWKLVSFHTEDVATKERSAFYGEQPIGHMKLESDGQLSAWIASGWPVNSAPSSVYRAVFYSGRYRIEDRRFAIRVERAEHEGFVGAAPFDLSWSEGFARPALILSRFRYFLREIGWYSRRVAPV